MTGLSAERNQRRIALANQTQMTEMADKSNQVDTPNDRDVGDQQLVHTPGPWKVLRRFEIYQDLGPNVGGTYIGTTAGNRVLPESVARVDEENARLMAAAPELLDACRDVLDAIEQSDLGGEVLWIKRGSPIHESASDRLQDVIERATCKPVV